MKGDGNKTSYMHDDNTSRYYAPLSKQDALFTSDSKYYGRTAKLLLWSNYSIKSILMNLRDNTMPGIKWLVDIKDNEYEQQLYSEKLVEEVDKKSGQKRLRWIQIGEANEWLDCESMNLVMAMRLNIFSATKINEDELSKLIDNDKKKQ